MEQYTIVICFLYYAFCSISQCIIHIIGSFVKSHRRESADLYPLCSAKRVRSFHVHMLRNIRICHYRYQACDLGNPDYIGKRGIHLVFTSCVSPLYTSDFRLAEQAQHCLCTAQHTHFTLQTSHFRLVEQAQHCLCTAKHNL